MSTVRTSYECETLQPPNERISEHKRYAHAAVIEISFRHLLGTMRSLHSDLVLLSLLILLGATNSFVVQQIPHLRCKQSSEVHVCPCPPLRASGLYKKFADYCWTSVEDSGLFEELKVPPELGYNESPLKGTEDGVVRITTKAMTAPASEDHSMVKYARVALIETIISGEDTDLHRSGIQVLNFVVIPSDETNLPVLGIDLVSLPGNRHLLLLDAQPMALPNKYEDHWESWHKSHVDGNPVFPWGGDFPEAVQPYVSKYSLWTRLQESKDPTSTIENEVWDAFIEHADLYFELLKRSTWEEASGENVQTAYLEYRKGNDPAKPMLNSLYGPEWTTRILDEVLFPIEL